MGHSLNERPNVVGGDAETVMIDPETKLRLGAADPRTPAATAVGY
jgi:hypothetical protein